MSDEPKDTTNHTTERTDAERDAAIRVLGAFLIGMLDTRPRWPRTVGDKPVVWTYAIGGTEYTSDDLRRLFGIDDPEPTD